MSADVTLQNQESLYGVKELINASGVAKNSTVAINKLVNTTGIQVFGDGLFGHRECLFVAVHIAEDPLSAVAEGAGKVLEELAFLKRVSNPNA